MHSSVQLHLTISTQGEDGVKGVVCLLRVHSSVQLHLTINTQGEGGVKGVVRLHRVHSSVQLHLTLNTQDLRLKRRESCKRETKQDKN